MVRRTRRTLWSRSFQRTLSAMTRTARKRTPAKRTPAPEAKRSTGIAIGPAGARRYRLYKPPGVRSTERLPLVVMLHGCLQDAEALAASSQMNRIAAHKRFFVLYPQQDRFSNAQGCWSWYGHAL